MAGTVHTESQPIISQEEDDEINDILKEIFGDDDD